MTPLAYNSTKMKCYTCKRLTPIEVYIYFWETYNGRERPHCSEKCREKTRAKKAKVKSS